MRKTVLAVLLALFALGGLSGCKESIPAGHVGKILGPTGFQPEIYPPSRTWVGFREEMFFVQTTTKKYKQDISVLLQDKLTLTVTIAFRGRIAGDDKTINSIFNDMKMDDDIVTTDEVYHTYAQMVVMNTARGVISKYNVDEVNVNYDRITKELYLALEPKLVGLPIEISDVTIGAITYPTIVTDAIGKAKERRMQIEQEQANVEIALTKAHGQEEIAKAKYNVKMLEAKRIRDYNKMVADGITADLLKLRELEIREAELAKWNGNYPLNATTVMGGNVPVMINSNN